MNKAAMLKEFLSNPKQTGSVIPSSRYLIKKMVKDISKGDSVVELGSGTGCITSKIAQMHCGDIHVYENNVRFAKQLEKFDFLAKDKIHRNAFHMDSVHKESSIDLIVSSLPLVNFSYKERLELLIKSFNILKPNGKFTMFTYKFIFPLMIEDLDKIGFSIVEKQIVWLNFPPATVISLQKRDINECRN